MQFWLSEQTIERINLVFARHTTVEKVVLYGSRAKGTHKPSSDIDLTLYGYGISQKEKNRILDELEELDLPYSIALLVSNQLIHVQLRDHIERVEVVFYGRNLDICAG